MRADLVFLNGCLITPEGSGAQALAVRAGRIVALGSNERVRPLMDARTEVADLQGKALLPGFVDAHTHLLRTGLERTLWLDLSGARSLDEVLQRVGEAARQREAGRWIVGRGWDESAWPQGRYITRADLDRVAPHHPVALIRVCGHLLTANGKALEAVLPLLADPDAEAVDRAQGLLREEGAWAFLDRIEPDLDQRKAAVLAGIAHAHSLGITAVHEVADPAAVEAYRALHREGRLKLRVRLNIRHPHLDQLTAQGTPDESQDEYLRLGALKLFADGSIGARNAALMEPYADRPDTRGQLNHPPERLEALLRRGRERGFQLMVHAIGDRAIEAVLTSFEAIGVTPQDRARIEHLELPHEEHLERMARMGVIASMQPNFLQWSGPGRMYTRRLGEERDARVDPHRRVRDAGMILAFGSDGMPMGPLYGVHLAVNAPHASQRLSVEEALEAYTLGGAYAGFAEGEQGSLAVGRYADLVVLDRDPRKAPDRLVDLKVERVYLGGERVHPVE